jgi:putative ABC transport system permease protein
MAGWFPERKEQTVRFADVLGLALVALWQRKLRTVLTLLGVIFGTLVLVASLSLGRGVQDTIVREYSRHNQLRNIQVHPGRGRPGDAPEEELRIEGEVNAERRQRLRTALAERWQMRNSSRPQMRLTSERMEQLRQIERVASVRPLIQINGRLVHGKQAEYATLMGVEFDNERLRGRLVAGRLPGAGEEQSVVVSEPVLYFLGVHSDAELEQALGTKLRVEYHLGGRSPYLLLVLLGADSTAVRPDDEKVLDKALAQLPAAVGRMDLSAAEKATLQKLLARRPKLPYSQAQEVTIADEFTLAGVVRAPQADEWSRDLRFADVFLSQPAAEQLFLRAPPHREFGFEEAVVTAERLEDVKAVTEAIRREGFQAFSMMDLVDRERFIYLLVFAGMTCIAVIALVVAALGIMNTMLIGVLERTREIGVLKAVGARDSTILLIFLVEGALIGLVGGLLGLLLSWSASFPGDAWVRSMVNRQLTVKLEQSLFAFPWWLLVGAPLFATLTTTLAAVLPARRAARINPVEALRHE